MEGIKRFIDCTMPYYFCNLLCEYCYVIQGEYRGSKELKLDYNIDIIKQSLTKERFGGMCFFSICAAGETLAPKETVPIVSALLDNGHFVNVTNNGTMSKRIKELCKLPDEMLQRLLLSFSFHYLELKRLNLMDTFFYNVQTVKDAGISFFIQINLYDGYIQHIDEIKSLCMERLGVLPQVPATRKMYGYGWRLHTEHEDDGYFEAGRQFNSLLFEFTTKNFMRKRREFCYAGDWSFKLNLGTGILYDCYGINKGQNIFENPDRPIKFRAIGNTCPSIYCVNASHFMSQGIIPSIVTPTYAELRNRPEAGWFNETALEYLNGKLSQTNREYTASEKLKANAFAVAQNPKRLIPDSIKNTVRGMKDMSNWKNIPGWWGNKIT